ncbi:unnamed protein product [Phytomonas sp. EM1]|nr:unnamed protein product [Phytomonas sp. EM1]|eukprot:CCW61398.1 unnamed protein product [Phytomonas sp. isolate EM1]
MDEEIRFLNNCLSSARQVHTLVSASFAGTEGGGHSILLDEPVQNYLKYLYSKYANHTALQSKLHSGRSLYYLQCLSDPNSRKDFLQIASNPSFINTD